MDIVKALKLTSAEIVFVGSAALAAITVTVVALGIALGDVYRPVALTEPDPAGLMDQVTFVFVDF